jgi:hypothetical protein
VTRAAPLRIARYLDPERFELRWHQRLYGATDGFSTHPSSAAC